MKAIRCVTLLVLFALAAAMPAAANDGTDDQTSRDLGLFKAAFAEYREALMALRDVCAQNASSEECRQGVKDLRAFLHDARVVARQTAEQIREQRKQEEERARQEEKQRAEDEQRAKEERTRADEAARKAAEEKRKAEERAKLDQQKKAEQEKAKQKQQPVDTKAKKELLQKRLAALDELIEFDRAQWDTFDTKARSLRDAALKAAGAERDRLMREAADADRAAGEFAQWYFKYEDEKKAVQQQLDQLAKDPTAQKQVAKLQQRLKDLDGVIVYKTGLRDESLAQAEEYRRIADTKVGDEREKYLHKAADAEAQAEEWERLANEYRAERDRVQAELDRLLNG